jgi:putative DNA primase/helicase
LPLRQALAYSALGARVFPCAASKRPLTRHGHKDASCDPTIIRAWWERKWPYADIAIALPNSVVVVDLDVGPNRNGFRDFRELDEREAVTVETPIASTPSGGLHIYYLTEGAKYCNGVSLNGFAIDVRTEGGYVIAPSGPRSGRRWIRSPLGPWAPAPAWLTDRIRVERQHETTVLTAIAAFPSHSTLKTADVQSVYRGDSPYGTETLRRICADIRSAPNGSQETSLNAGAFKIGRLIGASELGGDALKALIAAGLSMPSYDPRGPWDPAAIETKVLRAVEQGRRRPWTGFRLAGRA